MTEGYEEDLDMYEEGGPSLGKQLDKEVLLRPIRQLRYPRKPYAVRPNDSVRQAVETMANHRVGCVLVLDDQRKVMGIFGERDILMKQVNAAGQSLDRPVKELMTADPVCLTPDDTIASALNRMVLGGYRHIPLVDQAGVCQGILPMRDVVRFILRFFPEDVVNLPPYSEQLPPDHAREGG